MIVKVLGLDPSLSNWGFASADLDTDTLEVSNIKLRLVETSPTKVKQTRKSTDDLRRAQELYRAISEESDDFTICFAEVPHGSQSARAMASYGICIGLLSAVESMSFVQLSERDLKMETLGRASGTKEEAIEWATTKHPEANWLKRGGKITKKNEHLADALAAIYAGLKSEDFRNAMSLLRQIGNKRSA